MKVAGALACAALVAVPAAGSAEITSSINVPPGWTAYSPKHGERGWKHDTQFMILDSHPNLTRLTLRAYVNDIVVPAAISAGGKVVSSGPTATCAGHRPAWRVVVSLPAERGQRGLAEVIVTVRGTKAYDAAYMRLSTDPPRADAERAIRSLCLAGT